jgi:hypothetical protein
MGYAVFHRDEAGTPTVEDVASLEAALEIVERSRNGEGPRDVRVFREVPIAVRTYYKVHVADEVDAPAAASETATPTGADVTAEVAAVDVSVEGEAPVEVDVPVEADVVAEVPVVEVADEQTASATVATDDPYDVRRLLDPAPPVVDGDRPAPPPLPGAFPLAGPAVSQPTVEVHPANLEDEEGPKRHSLFGRGG